MVGQTLAHYRILEKIGSGGMGDVYLAEDTKLGRKVALKVLPPELAESEERRARFKREAKALAALDHPNIVQVFSVEEAEGIHFITMQLVHGKTLTELLPKNGFPLNKFFDILVEQQDVHDPRWSPDGEWLTFSSFGVHVPPRIWLMHRSETKPDVLVTGQRHPEWSPDGKHVFFTREVVGGVTSAIGRGELWAVESGKSLGEAAHRSIRKNRQIRGSRNGWSLFVFYLGRRPRRHLGHGRRQKRPMIGRTLSHYKVLPAAAALPPVGTPRICSPMRGRKALSALT